MLFMLMLKTNARMEAGCPPDQQIITDMGKLVGESIEKGIFQNGASASCPSRPTHRCR